MKYFVPRLLVLDQFELQHFRGWIQKLAFRIASSCSMENLPITNPIFYVRIRIALIAKGIKHKSVYHLTKSKIQVFDDDSILQFFDFHNFSGHQSTYQ